MKINSVDCCDFFDATLVIWKIIYEKMVEHKKKHIINRIISDSLLRWWAKKCSASLFPFPLPSKALHVRTQNQSLWFYSSDNGARTTFRLARTRYYLNSRMQQTSNCCQYSIFLLLWCTQFAQSSCIALWSLLYFHNKCKRMPFLYQRISVSSRVHWWEIGLGRLQSAIVGLL